MNISEAELTYEKRHLEETISTIKEIIDSKNVDIEDYKSSIVKRKRFLYEHSNEFFGADLHAHMAEEDLNVDILNRDIVKVYKLYRSLETPYFSRIDFKSDDEDCTFYIGLTGIDKDYDIIVYDWRAPVANLYYNYGLGPSSYEGGEGLIEGETTLKRQFDIKMGVMEGVYDNGVGVNDFLLESVLENNTSEYMRNIVDTIQKEQNDIIRYPGNNTLVVEGVAGSGKTSVALHRIAYLLYNQKDLNDKNVLIFSPSDVFTNYISNVLPELGEENVSTTTFKEFAEKYIKGYRIESLTEFIERYYEADEHSDDEEVKYRMSEEYKENLKTCISQYFDTLKFTKKMGLKKTFITSEELNELKKSVPADLSFFDKMVYLSEKICAKFKIDEVGNSGKMYKIINKILGIEKDPVELFRRFTGRNVEEVIHYDDVFIILFIYFEIHGYPLLNYIKQVVIDEAQDYSLWQLRMIKKSFNSATFTILGDKNQAINPYLQYETLEEITEIFKGSKYKRLDKTYRSSKEIIEYSNGILGLTNVESVRPSYGITVEEFQVEDIFAKIKECIENFKSKGFKRIAVITKTTKEAASIKENIDLDGVDVIAVYMAKGLEYDAVIVSKTGFKETERNLLYVAVTRALHALAIVSHK